MNNEGTQVVNPYMYRRILMPTQNDQNFTADIFKDIFFNKMFVSLFKF